MNKLYFQIYHKLKKAVSSLFLKVLFKVHPAYIFSALLLITLFWASFLASLKFNYDIESFFSSEDPEVDFYYNHLETFENENDYVLIGIKNNKGLFQKDFLERIDTLSKSLKLIPGIRKIFSPTNLYETIKGPLGSLRIPLLHIHNPRKYTSDKKRIYQSGHYINSFFSQDAKSISLLLKNEGELSRQANNDLLLKLNTTLTSYEFDEFHIAGRIRTQHYYVNKMQKQMALFGFLAFVLFIGSLFIIFKCIRYVLLSLGAVLLSLIWIFGIIGWLGIPLDLMITLLPTLIFVISTSGSIHLISRFRDEYTIGVAKQTAIKKSIVETGMPNFMNALTTAIGFASLALIPVAPIQRFGLLTATGILISFFICILFVPTALKAMQINPSRNASLQVQKKSTNLVLLAFKKPMSITIAFAFIILVGIYFSSQLKINNNFLDDLSPSSSLKKDLDFFEQNFSGIRPFEINIQANSNQTVLDFNALQEMDTVEKYLKKEYNVGFLFSPLNLIESVNKAIHGGDKDYYCLPTSQSKLNVVLKTAEKQRLWERFFPVVTEDRLIGRISGRTLDEGSGVFMKRNEKLEEFLKHNTQYLTFKITGAAQLMDNANSHIAWNLMKGMMLAIAVTTLAIGLFTRSWKLAAISLIPNLIPLILVSGFMGAAGIPLKVATSLIFTITYGIAVDDTIHFLNSYRLNRKIYPDINEALNQTFLKMWRPMLSTSVVLFSGFMIFLLSEFSSISTLGLLISGSLIVALLTDLLLLPILLTSSVKYLVELKKYKLAIVGRKQLVNKDQPNLNNKVIRKSNKNYAVKI